MDNTIHRADAVPDDDVEQPERRRTVWIWLIFGWSLYGLLSAFASATFLLWAGQPNNVPGLRPLDLLFSLLSIGIFFAAALALVLLKSVAVKLFMGALIFNALYSIYFLRDPEVWAFMEALGGSSRYGMIGGLGFSIAGYIVVVLYALRLRRRGVLV